MIIVATTTTTTTTKNDDNKSFYDDWKPSQGMEIHITVDCIHRAGDTAPGAQFTVILFIQCCKAWNPLDPAQYQANRASGLAEWPVNI